MLADIKTISTWSLGQLAFAEVLQGVNRDLCRLVLRRLVDNRMIRCALLIFLNLIDGFMKSSLETTLNKLEYELNQGILTINISLVSIGRGFWFCLELSLFSSSSLQSSRQFGNSVGYPQLSVFGSTNHA